MQFIPAVIALFIAVRLRYIRDVEQDFAAGAQIDVAGRAGQVAPPALRLMSPVVPVRLLST